MEDEWKTTGDCENCRRKPYCKKSCAKHKAAFKEYLWGKMVEKYGEEVANKIDKEAFFAGLLGAVSNGNMQATADDVPVAE